MVPSSKTTEMRHLPAGLPNIVLFNMDDVGIGDVTSYHAESKIPTPSIDAVAKRGVSFDDAHSTSAVCTPFRPPRTILREGAIAHDT